MRVGTFPAPWGVQTSTERSEVGANTPLLRSRRQTPLWRLSACTGEVYYCKEPRDRDEMMKFLGIKHRTTFRSDYLNPLLDEGKIAMTIPDKPRSKNQKFYSV